MTRTIPWMTVLWVSAANPAAAQQGGVIGGGGVYVDAAGVLRAREVDGSDRLDRSRRDRSKAGRRADSICYISLPRLFDLVKAQAAAGSNIDSDLRYLDGMVKLTHIFAFPDEKDLVIAGPAEPYDAASGPRPVGQDTGRPVLRLDDLVVALRTVGPGRPTKVFGCSLDLEPAATGRLQSTAARIGAVARGQYSGAARRLINAVGPQHVRYFGVQPDTPFAFVCIEADYLLKRLALGLARPPIPGFKSHMSLLGPGEGVYHRFWFTADYEPLLISADGLAFEIRGQGLRVQASNSRTGDAGAAISAVKFAEQFSRDFPRLAETVGSFADLWNLADLAVLAALIDTDGLAAKCNWDLDWVLDGNGYPVPQVTVPKTAEALGNYKVVSKKLLFAAGGVSFDMQSTVAKRNSQAPAAAGLRSQARRPKPGQWSLRTSPE
jgi:hypothetical protein